MWACPSDFSVGEFSPTAAAQGPVQVWVQSGTSKQRVPVRAGGGGALGLMYFGSPATLAGRVYVSVPSWTSVYGSPIPAYFLSGTYSITAQQIPTPLQLTESSGSADGTREYSMTALHGLDFRNPTEPYYWAGRPSPSVTWRFIPGENVSDVPGGYVWNARPVGKCEDKLVCAYKPSGPGKMEATAWVEGREVTIRASGVKFVAPEMTLSCPARVTRGDDMSCSVRVIPSSSGTLTDIQWQFTDMKGHVSRDSARESWGGKLVVGGRMKVTAILDGKPVGADTVISVEARNWAGRVAYPSGLPHEQVDASRFPALPVRVGADGFDQWISGALGSYEWDLDWSGKFQPVSSGPNEGYWYMKDPPVWAEPEVYLSGHLEPGHPFYEAQTGRRPGDRNPPREYQQGWCTKAHMDALRQEIREHEGSVAGARLSHHAFNVQYTGRNDPGPAVEGIAFRPAPTDNFVSLAEQALGTAYDQALATANHAAVHASANLYTVTCKVHLP